MTTREIEEKLAEMGLTLPAPPVPGGSYKAFHRDGGLLFLAGAISIGGGETWCGQLGREISLNEGRQAAQLCALNQLASMREALGGFDAVRQIISLNGYVNAVPNFPDSPAVINGASDLFIALFGEAGRHVRAAVAVTGLPKGAAVEIQMTVGV